jgi:TetR/AcrR family transcriptional regulator, regulator of cefoperazone and chloramphenicol sensitivity
MTTTTAQAADLTAKARIRIAALELFAEHGSAAATMRQVAERAGVTVGLVTHHYGSKEALRQAVDEYVVESYRDALAAVPPGTSTQDVPAVRDRNVASMLLENVALQKYLRRAYMEPEDGRRGVLERLTDLTMAEVRRLRADRIASTTRSETEQVMQVVIRQLGELLMQPLVDRLWGYLDGSASPPAVHVAVERSAESR